MSETTFGVNDANAIKLWSKDLARVEREYLEIEPLMGEDENSVINIKNELQKGSGDQVKFNLITDLTQDGKTENETAEGNGESLSFFQDSLVINELGGIAATRSENTIDAQRVSFDLRDNCKRQLAVWWARRKSVTFFNQVCGYTPQTNTKYTGLNPVSAPSSGRKMWASTATSDETLNNTMPFTLDLIDQAVELATVGDNPIQPLVVGGQKKFICYLHPYQVTSLRTNFSSGQWGDIQKAALMGGASSKSPLYTNALGEYNNVILRRSQDVTQGVNSSTGAAITTVRRAVLLGRQAACMGFGKKNTGANKYRWNEELLDHKRKLEVSAWLIYGMKKSVYNSADFGALTISSYAAAST